MKEKIDGVKTAAPDTSPSYLDEDAGFWTGAEHGLLKVRRCRDCNATHHYPRAVCPFCGSENLGWLTCQGTGIIYSFSITRPKNGPPAAIAYVNIPEGVCILCQVLNSDLERLKIGDPVRFEFKRQNDASTLPYCVRDEEAAAVRKGRQP